MNPTPYSTTNTQELTEQKPNYPIWSFKDTLTASEAAAYMGITKRHLYTLTTSRAIPHYKPRGKMMYFLKSDLDAFMHSNKIATMAEIAQDAAVNQSKKGGNA